MTLDPTAREAARAVFIASCGYSPDDFLDKALAAYLAALLPSPPRPDAAVIAAAAIEEAAKWLEEQADEDLEVAEAMPEYSPEIYKLLMRRRWRRRDAAAIRSLKETR